MPVDDALVDPRGHFDGRRVSLAARPRDLNGRCILLVDNGKLDPRYGPWAGLYEELEPLLREASGAARLPRLRDDLLVGAAARMIELAERIAAEAPDAAVIALNDYGVTLPALLLATELEQRRIPTVSICAHIGARVAGAVASRLAPGLPLIEVDLDRMSTPDEVRAAARAALPLVVGFLTGSASRDDRSHAGALARAIASTTDAGGTADTVLLTRGGDAARTDSASALYDFLSGERLGDGLPVVLPTRGRVAALLAEAGREPDEILVPPSPPFGIAVTAEKAAANAVMAGCAPGHFAFVVAALLAMADPRYRLFQAAMTTHPAGNAIVVSGPGAEAAGIHAGPGCMGPGFRANAAIGRAVTLVLINVVGAVPDRTDMSLLGSPAEFTYCFAENLARSPWPGLHVERGQPEGTTVTVLKCEGPHNVLDALSTTPERLLDAVAAAATTIAANNAYNPAELLVVLNPEHARIVARAGWSKDDARRYLYDRARHPREALAGRGILPTWPERFQGAERVPVVPDPDDILIVVAGAPGPQSAVGIPWGYSRAVTRAVRTVTA